MEAFEAMKPHCCPVCNGSGRVSYPPGISGDIMRWSSSSTDNYPCTPCGGTGVLWERAPTAGNPESAMSEEARNQAYARFLDRVENAVRDALGPTHPAVRVIEDGVAAAMDELPESIDAIARHEQSQTSHPTEQLE